MQTNPAPPAPEKPAEKPVSEPPKPEPEMPKSKPEPGNNVKGGWNPKDDDD